MEIWSYITSCKLQVTQQSIKISLMAIIIGRLISPLMSFNVQPSNSSNKRAKEPKTHNYNKAGRRDLFLLSTVLIADSRADLLNEYLKKSEENKVKNDKERLDSYYKRNYKDYFGLLEGDLRQKTDLSESEKGILEWLDANK